MFDVRDADVYTLQVAVGWYFGDSSPKDPPKPLLVGGHMGHQYSACSLLRSLVSGAPISVYLSPSDVKGPAASSARKCRDGDGLGRWVSFAQRNDPCAPPLCTGNRQETVNKQDWVRLCDMALRGGQAEPFWRVGLQDGNPSRNWVWVPYDCYYHLYSRDDVYNCAQKTGIDWIHTMGDSQEREFIAHMKMMNGSVTSTTKFEQTDFVMHESPNNLRITWQFYTETFLWTPAFENQRQFDMDKKLFDHFNVVPSEVCQCSY
jgi:hypothetical protein